VPDGTAGEALQSAWEVEAKPARDVLRQRGHDDLVEAVRVPDGLDREEWIGVAHDAGRRDPGVAKTGDLCTSIRVTCGATVTGGR
jgi:hypothetical protein